MKVLQVGLFAECAAPIVNGVSVAVDILADTLVSNGCEVTHITPWFPGLAASSAAVPISRIHLPSMPLPTHSGYRFALPDLRSTTRNTLDRLDILHAHSLFRTGALAAAQRRRRRRPMIFTYHTRLREYAHYAPGPVWLSRAYLSRQIRRFADSVDLVTAPTKFAASELEALGIRTKIVVRPSGIDVSRFAMKDAQSSRFLLSSDAVAMRKLLYVGRLAREKNPLLLIEAFTALDPSTTLLFVGDGPLRAQMEIAASRLGVSDRVRFLGIAAPSQLPAIYAASDCFVATSITETQGLVFAEALAAGLPIVAVDSMVTREMLAATDARIVDNSAFDLARALRAPFADGPAMRATRRVSAERFDGEKTTRAFLDDYLKLHETYRS